MTFQYKQKTVKVCGYTFKAANFKDAESYARTVYADTVGTFGVSHPKSVKAAREWTKVQNLLATAIEVEC